MRVSKLVVATLSVAMLCGSAWALKPGEAAPEFKGTNSNGKTETLGQYRGKYVVLEWANQGCPYDRKHYLSGNMERLQREWTAKGVVWLSVISSAPGEQGYVTPPEENAYLEKMHAVPTAAILDPSGTIGRLYGAKTTPHVFVIDPQGRLVYEGALDDQPTPDPASLKGAHNYLDAALKESMAGKAVTTPVTRPYGCNVKYGN
ncbi:redoxin domain-containing protein [Granulicella sp. 5B5]|uniref:redoxin domain-containing protein n=1 Tax=Granulicella sp. 5B5 TaxID=1617967 RepID=UPI0015F35491|nr:redoxin domain-containing protein [Granulicella sp. 5B5]QMV19859.1 redoxin domain-containing protein [Granulicella sp. 5B5]